MTDRPAQFVATEPSADALREKSIKQATRILAPHFDGVLILMTWRDAEGKTQNDATLIGNENTTDGLAKNFVENGCTFDDPPPEEGQEWLDGKERQ